MNNHQLFIYITVGGALVTVAAKFLLTNKSGGTASAAPSSTTAS